MSIITRNGLRQEYRYVALPSELRVSSEDKPPRIEGYAAVFNQPSEILSDWLGRFVEFVAEGAFTKTLKDGADVRALVNHDPNFVLGRTKANTLRLWEDSTGLGFDVTPPDTLWVRDYMETVRRGDVSGASFGFRMVRDRWDLWTNEAGEEVDRRWLLEAQLFDVSTATYPAYPQTEISARSLSGEGNEGLESAVRVWMEHNAQKMLTDFLERKNLAELTRAKPVGPTPSGHPEAHADDDAQRFSRLRLAVRDNDQKVRTIRQ